MNSLVRAGSGDRCQGDDDQGDDPGDQPQQQLGRGRVLDVNPQGESANCTPLWPGLPMVVEVEPVRGFNPTDVLRYKEYLQFVSDSDDALRPVDRLFTCAQVGTFAVKNPSLASL